MSPLLILANDITKQAQNCGRLLVNHEADLNLTNKKGYSALSLCVIHNNIVLAKLLVENDARMFN